MESRELPRPAPITVYVRKPMVDGGSVLLEFRARELSARRAFLASDDLGLLDLDEEVEVVVAADGGPFAAAAARVVCSERSFGGGRGLTASGFGLELLAAGAGFRAAVDGQLRAAAGALPEAGLEPARSVRTKGF